MNLLAENQKTSHTLTLSNCETLELCGVTDVRGFDEGTVLLETACGPLTVEGEGLHVTHLGLEEGRVTVTGRIAALFYSQTGTRVRGGFFSRLFG